jgi:predicted nucleotidyltransferase
VAVTNHPRFKNYFEGKTNSALNQLKGCVSPDKIESVTKLIQQPDSDTKNDQINELLSEMSPVQQGRFFGVINQLSAVQAEREGEILRAQQDYDQMMAQAKTEQDARKVKFDKFLEDTIKGMQDAKAGRPEYQLREGETEWNESVAKRLESGKKLIQGNLPADVMFKAAFDAAAYPYVLAAYKATLSELEKAQKQISAMSAANPKLESPRRTETSTGTTEAPMPKDARPMDWTKRWVTQFGSAMRGET